MKNTVEKGSVRFIVFKDVEDNQWYGVALEFNIVVSGDNHVEALHELYDAMGGYIETVASYKGVRDYTCLNQKPIKEYEDLWSRIVKKEQIPSPYHVGTHGMKEINA